MCPGETGEPLAQQAAREDVAASEGIGGVDGHEVEIAMQAAVLEAVVEHHDTGPGPRRRPGSGDPVGVGDVRHAGEQEGQLGRFVAHGAPRRAVAAGDDGRGVSRPKQAAGHPRHQRGLAGPAQGEVADADHRHRRGVGGEEAGVVGGVAGRHDAGPGGAQGPEQGAGEPAPGAAVGARDDPLE